ISGRVQKSSSSKSALRSAYNDVFYRFSSDDVMPYTHCFRAKRTYRIVEGAKTYQGYKNLKHPYNSLVVASSREFYCEEKEEQASNALLDLHEKLARVQAEVAEAAGRLSQIHTIQKRVKEHHIEIFTQGMQELEEDNILPALDAHKGSIISDL
ncbi:hypothetical protein K456DRAFT_1828011, partial [Colletotrichum gloeosporioides 23]